MTKDVRDRQHQMEELFESTDTTISQSRQLDVEFEMMLQQRMAIHEVSHMMGLGLPAGEDGEEDDVMKADSKDCEQGSFDSKSCISNAQWRGTSRP